MTMKKISFTLLSFLLLAVTVQAAVPVKTLIEEGKKYDRTWVEITGEVFGDIMPRGDHYWINVLSPEGTAIGVLCKKYQTKKIKTLGDYNHRGDRVLIKGYFYRYFQEQGGETAIRAYQLEVLRPGFERKHPLAKEKALTSVLILLLALGLGFLYLKIHHKSAV